jgi:hypothetical protein
VTEFATAPAEGSGPFPAEWGWPEGRAGSDERREWIRRHIGSQGEQRLRQLADRDAALTVVLERALLEKRR